MSGSKIKFLQIFFILLISKAITSCLQKSITIPINFIETIPPQALSIEWQKLNQDENEFEVKIKNGQLQVNKPDGFSDCELKIIGGTLTGFDSGEFGGGLYFIPNNISKPKIKIAPFRIRFLFNYKDKIYFISGYSHMGFIGGGLFELKEMADSSTYNKILVFEDDPEAFTIYKDKFLIATGKNFYIVKDLKKTLVFKNTFWDGLYPNSIAVFNDKNVFLGMRSGIVKLDLTTKKMTYFRYNK